MARLEDLSKAPPDEPFIPIPELNLSPYTHMRRPELQLKHVDPTLLAYKRLAEARLKHAIEIQARDFLTVSPKEMSFHLEYINRSLKAGIDNRRRKIDPKGRQNLTLWVTLSSDLIFSKGIQTSRFERNGISSFPGFQGIAREFEMWCYLFSPFEGTKVYVPIQFAKISAVKFAPIPTPPTKPFR